MVDLTEANPTRVDLSGSLAGLLPALADPAAERYDPDPRGSLAARQAVASYLAARGTPASPDDVVLTTGTSESYAHLFRLLADPGDAILVPAPSYPLIEPIAALEAVEVVPYRLRWDGAWHLDLASVDEALAAAAGRARAVIVIEPNHPTGSCLDSDERQALESRLETAGAALISDEVFADFHWAPRPALFPGMLGERRVPTFVLGGLSKCCGLPQLKLGWIVAAGPPGARRRGLEGLEWIADLFLSVASPVQYALPSLLAARHAYQAKVRERLALQLATLARFVGDHPEATMLAGEGGWAAILRLPAPREEEWSLALLERDVIVHPGHFYDLEQDGCVVLSLIAHPDAFRAGLDRIAAALDER